MLIGGAQGALKGLFTFTVGYFAGKNGAFDKLFLNDFFSDYTGMSLGRGVLAAIFKSPIRNLITNFAIFLGDFLTKLFLVSSVAAGLRKLID